LLSARSFPLSVFHSSGHLEHLPSFPTRRSSDLAASSTPVGRSRRSPPTVSSTGNPAARTCSTARSSPSIPGRGAYSSSPPRPPRSEEHTSELQSRFDLVCRLLLEKKNRKIIRDD